MDGLRIVIVGGSLSGLSAALALAPVASRVTIIERNVLTDTGGGLGIDRDTLSRVTGRDAIAGVPAIASSFRDITTWALLHGWLAREVTRTPNITRLEGRTAVTIEPDAVTDDAGEQHAADLIVGADGYRSTVRRYVAPHHADGTYAGYLLWRALVPESAADTAARTAATNGVAQSDQLFVCYPVPGRTGSTARGERQFTFGWYDTRWTAALRTLGVLDGTIVRRTLRAEDVPHDIAAQLLADADRWPSPWNAVARYAIEHRIIFATPINEYEPITLTRESAALVGDAAHVAPPILGAGFETALEDIAALRTAITSASSIAQALARYERDRLPAAQHFVQTGHAWSHRFTTHP